MEFRNHTPFPAQDFEGIDQHNQPFYVIALRQTFSFASGKLGYADDQEPLCEVDEFYGEMNQSSVRQESDLCQFKPRCDVIVNATAYAPRNQPAAQFEVRLRVYKTGAPPPLPELPRGLNPTMSASQADMDQWRRAVAQIKAEPLPQINLIDKTLTVCGPRVFEKQGLLGLGGWQLTAPEKISTLPLRYEYAYGGQCRIEAADKAVQRIPKQQRLTDEQITRHPDKGHPPAAHTVYEPNIVGQGYAQSWYLDATKRDVIPAPQIEYPSAPINTELFAKNLHNDAPATSIPAGFGIRAKVHPERRRLLGTIDETFIKSDAWLPQDFDFAVWNAAPKDQQTDHLKGNERIELTNLCAVDAPGAIQDKHGNICLTLTLPDHVCTLLMRMVNGTMFFHPMKIDTVIVEPDRHMLSVVWRAVFAKDPGIRAVDARLHREFELGFMQRLSEEAAKQPPFDLSKVKRTASIREHPHG